MESALSALLFFVQSTLPLLPAGGGFIERTIDVLTKVIPFALDEYKDLKPIIANIITALRSDGSTTIEQLDALDVLEARLDADFDAAASAAEAEDAAAETKAPAAGAEVEDGDGDEPTGGA